jgi:hypothetical protein
MSAHTPGPWRYLPGDGPAFRPLVMHDEGGFIVQGRSREREEADAKLIAAAPDLLKQLEMCVTALEMAGVGASLICKDARVAIAMATGAAA